MKNMSNIDFFDLFGIPAFRVSRIFKKLVKFSLPFFQEKTMKTIYFFTDMKNLKAQLLSRILQLTVL